MVAGRFLSGSLAAICIVPSAIRLRAMIMVFAGLSSALGEETLNSFPTL